MLPHPFFATDHERSNQKMGAALLTLQSGIDDEHIRNVHFNDAKSDLSRAYERERDRFRTIAPQLDIPVEERYTSALYHAWSDAVWDLPYEFRHLSASLKKLPKMRKGEHAENPIVKGSLDMLEQFAERWLAAAALIEKAKPFIVKGHVKGERKTPERTLENTGSCACCGNNVKMNNGGTLVDHGFQIMWEQRNGNCFGVGHEPWEVSPNGAIAYVKAIEARVKQAEETIGKLRADTVDVFYVERRVQGKTIPVQVGRDDPEFQKIRSNRIVNLEAEIRNLESTRELYQARIDKWEPQPLPWDKLQAVIARREEAQQAKAAGPRM